MKSTKEIFVKNLKQRRKAKFRSQELFASLVGLSERGYQKYEQGESDPTPEILDRFAEQLGCSPWELLQPSPPVDYSSVPNVDDALELLSKYRGLSRSLKILTCAVLYEDATRLRALPLDAYPLLADLLRAFQKQLQSRAR